MVQLGNQLGALFSVQLCCLVADVNDNTLGGKAFRPIISSQDGWLTLLVAETVSESELD